MYHILVHAAAIFARQITLVIIFYYSRTLNTHKF